MFTACVQPVSGEAVTQGVAAGPLVNPGLLQRPVSPPLAGRMRARDGASPGPSAGPGRAHGPEGPRPAGLPRRPWGLAWPARRGWIRLRIPLQGPGDGGVFTASIGAFNAAPRVRGTRVVPVLTALGAPDTDEVLAAVHILAAQADALQQAQAAARDRREIPERSSRASWPASRRPVCTRSPALWGLREGATPPQTWPFVRQIAIEPVSTGSRVIDEDQVCGCCLQRAHAVDPCRMAEGPWSHGR